MKKVFNDSDEVGLKERKKETDRFFFEMLFQMNSSVKCQPKYQLI